MGRPIIGLTTYRENARWGCLGPVSRRPIDPVQPMPSPQVEVPSSLFLRPLRECLTCCVHSTVC